MAGSPVLGRGFAGGQAPLPGPARIGGMIQANTARTLIESVKTHRDPRGGVFEPLNDAQLAQQKNVHVVLTLPDEVRGNHFHQAATETATVVVPCLVRLKEAAGIRDMQVPAGETWRFTIPPGVV